MNDYTIARGRRGRDITREQRHTRRDTESCYGFGVGPKSPNPKGLDAIGVESFEEFGGLSAAYSREESPRRGYYRAVVHYDHRAAD